MSSVPIPDPTHVEAANGVLLRRPGTADVPGVLSVHGDPRVYVLDPHETQRDASDTARFLAPMLAHWQRHGFGYWSVLVPTSWWPEGVDDPSPVVPRVHGGLGGIQHHDLAGEPVLNVYFRFAPSVQGRGLGGQVLTQAVSLAPQVGPGLDLVVRTRPANTAARRVAERAGFRDLGPSAHEDDMQLLRLPAP